MANLLRYTLEERVVHWISAIAYTYALATGTAFWSPHLYWIAIMLGGAPTSRFWHPWISLVFVAALTWLLRAWLADMRITAADRWRGLRYTAVLLHAAAALVTTGAFIIHVYMRTAVVRGGFTSIIRGDVSPAWAKTHHRLGYNRVTRR